MQKTCAVLPHQKDYTKQARRLDYCAECGRCMLHHDRTNHPKYYSCGKYRENGAKACTSHHITYDNLCEIVLKDIQRHVQLVEEDEGRAIQKILSVKCSAEEKQLAKAKKELKQSKKRLEEMDTRIKRVYEDNLSGKIPDDLFWCLSRIIRMKSKHCRKQFVHWKMKYALFKKTRQMFQDSLLF